MLFEIHIPNRDSAELSLSKFLIIDLYASCVGVYQYQRSDGQLVNEYKSLDEIAKPVTMQSILGCPLSIHHPPDFFSPENFQQWLQWNFVGAFIEPGTMDGRRVKTRAIVYKRDAIDAIWDGILTEISMGSWHKPKAETGEFEGLSYSVLQTWIYYNHGSLYEPGGGRLGAAVGVSMDGKELQYRTHKLPEKSAPIQTQDSRPTEVRRMLIPLSNGKTVDVPDNVAQDVLSHIQAQDSRIQTLTNDNSQATAKLAVYEQRPAPATQAQDSGTDIDAAVEERQTILDSARELLPENYVFKGKSNTAVMLDALDSLNVKLPDAVKQNALAVRTAFDTALGFQAQQDTGYSGRGGHREQLTFQNLNSRITQDARQGGGQRGGYVTSDKRQDGGRGCTDNDLEAMNRHFNKQQKGA